MAGGRAQVCKVYIGSFNADVPVRTDLNPHGAELFAHEQTDLLQDLYEIPQRSCDRKARRPAPPRSPRAAGGAARRPRARPAGTRGRGGAPVGRARGRRPSRGAPARR